MAMPIASLRLGVIRPRDAAELYVQPRAEFLRLEETGVLLRAAHGYYALIPEASRGGHWRPEIEALALGIGQADYGKREVALMHISAARIHGAIPRALGVAVLAVPKQRPTLETTCGRIIFVKRNVSTLKRIRVETELATGWVTSLEQTILDLARRPDLVKGSSGDVEDAVRSLFARVNKQKLATLAKDQRLVTAIARVKDWAEDA